MINIDRLTIAFCCPRCRFINEFFYKQARLRDIIICRGCKRNIQLDDQMNECRKGRLKINKAIQELKDQLKDIKIEIKL